MNVHDRSLLRVAEQRAETAHGRRRRIIALSVAGVVLVIGLAVFYVWWTTLCGDCGAPALLPPPQP